VRSSWLCTPTRMCIWRRSWTPSLCCRPAGRSRRPAQGIGSSSPGRADTACCLAPRRAPAPTAPARAVHAGRCHRRRGRPAGPGQPAAARQERHDRRRGGRPRPARRPGQRHSEDSRPSGRGVTRAEAGQGLGRQGPCAGGAPAPGTADQRRAPARGSGSRHWPRRGRWAPAPPWSTPTTTASPRSLSTPWPASPGGRGGSTTRSAAGTDASPLLVVAGDDRHRPASEASFAAVRGVSPVQASSARIPRHRLDRGGHRRADAALFRAALTGLRRDPRTQAYRQRRTAQGLPKREILRCLIGEVSALRSTRGRGSSVGVGGRPRCRAA
jgi:Transposase IS116/IS110/IS902 family